MIKATRSGGVDEAAMLEYQRTLRIGPAITHDDPDSWADAKRDRDRDDRIDR